MQSFYGGPAGQSFEIKQIFTSYQELLQDISQGWKSPISVGEFVMVSYGRPGDEDYDTNRNRDLNAGDHKQYNSTLWQKMYDESAGAGSGLSYKLISSCTGNTPRLDVNSTVTDADVRPSVDSDLTNADIPKITFNLPQAQILSMEPVVVENADIAPWLSYDDETDINRPTVTFHIPQSQIISVGELVKLPVGEAPSLTLDIEDINKPVLKFSLPQSQEFTDENIKEIVLDADGSPTVAMTYAEDDTLKEHPILTFSLPQSQVMQAPETKVEDASTKPSIDNIGTVNEPKFRFHLPRATAFYYGSLLGERTAGTYTLTNAAFAEYGVGDYYINATTGFIYLVKSKTNDTTCVFEYVASIQQPLPSITASELSPYTEQEGSYQPTVPQVERTFTNSEETAWNLEFKLPKMPVPKVESSFVGSKENGSVVVNITDSDSMTFDFTIPTGCKLFAGLEVNNDKTTTVIEGAREGDIYLNSSSGIIYTLTNGTWVASEENIKGPVGDALHIVASYTINESEGYTDDPTSIGGYIDAHYTETINDQDLFGITFISAETNARTDYWYYKVKTDWRYATLTGGAANLIETKYNSESAGQVDNKAYSVHYINTLIGGQKTSDNKDTTAYSKEQMDNKLSEVETKAESLVTWGTFQELLKD